MSETIWQFAEQFSRLNSGQIACGVIRHPVTRHWQTWFSFFGSDITCIFASKDYALAHSVRQMFVAELRSGGFLKLEAIQQFMADIAQMDGSELVDPLPQRCIEQLGCQIRQQQSQQQSQ